MSLYLVHYLFSKAENQDYGKYSIDILQMKYFYLNGSLNKFVKQ